MHASVHLSGYIMIGKAKAHYLPDEKTGGTIWRKWSELWKF